jgi:hypothetical protein
VVSVASAVAPAGPDLAAGPVGLRRTDGEVGQPG